MNKIIFSEKLKFLRLNKNISQSQLAKNIGITRQALSKYELGTSEPTLYTLIKIADYFNCSLDSLVFDSIQLNENITILDLDYFESELVSIQQTNALLEIKIKNLKNSIAKLNSNSLSSSNKLYTEEYSDEISNIINFENHHLEDTTEYREVPHRGNIAAGSPGYAPGDVLDTFLIPEDKLSSKSEHYILKVSGDSMNLLFDDGDLILVECVPLIYDSDIVITRIDSEDATVKKVKFKDDTITLIPMSNNPIHKTKTYNKKDVRIQGKVLGKLSDFLKPSP